MMTNLSAPPMASTISLQSFIGGGNGLGSLPSIKPKSTWKRRPSSLRRRLSRCLHNKILIHSIHHCKKVTYTALLC